MTMASNRITVVRKINFKILSFRVRIPLAPDDNGKKIIVRPITGLELVD